jgi:large subunit ribosomal protein L30
MKLRITQIRSSIGKRWDQGATLRALGIKKMQQTVIHEDTPQIRGMVNKITHLLKVEEIS